MRGERASSAAGIAIAAVLGLWTVLLLVRGSVTIGAGDSAGFDRPVRDILRAANRALVNTGWDDTWRVAAWACGIGAVAVGVVLVWLASIERDATAPASDAFAPVGRERSAARPSGPTGHDGAESQALPSAGARTDDTSDAPGTAGTGA